MKKINRNDPCHCGSGKKFKKCCESKMIRGRYLATPIASTSPEGTSLSALFRAYVSRPVITQPLEDKGDILVPS
jgi:hypothetical protein